MDKIRWGICDDDKILTYAYTYELKTFSDLEFVGNADSAEACFSLIKKEKPDVLLLDIRMETEIAGIEVIPRLKEIDESLKIIMLTSFEDEDYIFNAFANGACDYLMKDTNKTDIYHAIKNAYTNNSVISSSIAQLITRRARDIEQNQQSLLYVLEIMSRLSKTEFEILKAIYRGDSYKKIAADRYVDVLTIRSHVSRIINKFGKSDMKAVIKNLKELRVLDLFYK